MAPRAGLELAAYCLGGIIATWLDGAGCGWMWLQVPFTCTYNRWMVLGVA